MPASEKPPSGNGIAHRSLVNPGPRREPTVRLREPTEVLSVTDGVALVPPPFPAQPVPRQPTPVKPGAVPYRPSIAPLQPNALPAPERESLPSPLPAGDDSEASDDSGELKPGDRIGSYEIVRLLGSGGMGSVYKARDTRLGRAVAIKLLHVDDPTESQRLLLEAQTTAKIDHDNIVSIYEVGHYRGKPYMVLEYVRGMTLKEVLAPNKKLPPGRAVELAVPIVRCLTSAHALGIVHRDLKPENIMVTHQGGVKVLDFGIAKATGTVQSRLPTLEPLVRTLKRQPSVVDVQASSSNLTGAGKLLGTLPYMAPEQWRGPGNVDARADIFSFGLVLYRMLAGSHPLGNLHGMEWAAIALVDRPMPRLGPEVPKELADVVARCLEKNRDNRYPDALALLKALEPLLPGRGSRIQLGVDHCPFPGLSSFQEADSEFFFGRDAATAELVTRVRDRPMVVLSGPSGVGKSSLIRAALKPALKASGEGWEVVFMRPGRDPLGALAAAISPMMGTPTTATVIDDLKSQDTLVNNIRAEPGFPGRVLRAHATRENRRVLLCVDQFEELYTLGAEPDRGDRALFTTCLAAIADDPSSPLRLVLVTRADFLARLADDDRLSAELGPALFFLAPPDVKALRQALEGPAQAVGYGYEAGIVENILEHLQTTPSSLPIMQFAASKLWEGRDTARRLLTAQSYEAIGGISGALSRHADSVIAAFSPQLQASARDLLLRLVTPERTAAVVALDSLRELPNAPELIEQLVRARLIVIERSERDGSTAALAHDALIQGWPTLARWIDDEGQDLGFLEQLGAAARLWSSNSRDGDLLWRGELLRDAASFRKRFRGELSQVEKAFLEQSFALETQEARRKRRRVVAALALMAAVALASFVAMGIIARARFEAVHQAQIARQAEAEATKQAAAAKQAETEATAAEAQARERLSEVQQKERERAEAARRAEEAKEQVKLANDHLQVKNQELVATLAEAKAAWSRANEARARAEASSKAERRAKDEARRHETQAIQAAKDLETALQREKKRVADLQGQVGSPLSEEL